MRSGCSARKLRHSSVAAAVLPNWCRQAATGRNSWENIRGSNMLNRDSGVAKGNRVMKIGGWHPSIERVNGWEGCSIGFIEVPNKCIYFGPEDALMSMMMMTTTMMIFWVWSQSRKWYSGYRITRWITCYYCLFGWLGSCFSKSILGNEQPIVHGVMPVCVCGGSEFVQLGNYERVLLWWFTEHHRRCDLLECTFDECGRGAVEGDGRGGDELKCNGLR